MDLPRIAAKLGSLANTAAVLSAIGAGVATLAAFAGSLWWRFDLLAHFRPQYALLLVACLGYFGLRRRWRPSLACAAALSLNAAVIAPLFVAPATATPAQASTISVVVFNVNYKNRRFSDVVDYLRAEDPDVFVLLELTDEWHERIEEALPGYRSTAEPRDDAFGIGAYSRVSGSASRVMRLGSSRQPVVETTIEVDGRGFSLLGIHTLPPVDRDASSARDALLDEARKWALEREGPSAIIGDFNATPWSHAFRALTEDGLVNSQRGFGLQTSWPRELWPLSVAIDHCVHTKDVRTVARSVGSFLGSDHRPLRLELEF